MNERNKIEENIIGKWILTSWDIGHILIAQKSKSRLFVRFVARKSQDDQQSRSAIITSPKEKGCEDFTLLNIPNDCFVEDLVIQLPRTAKWLLVPGTTLSVQNDGQMSWHIPQQPSKAKLINDFDMAVVE